MGFTRAFAKALTNRSSTEEYAAVLNRTLELFAQNHAEADQLILEVQSIESAEHFNAWGARYTAWQQNGEEGRQLLRQLSQMPPKDKRLRKFSSGVVIYVNHKNREITESFNMFLRTMNEDYRGANQAKIEAEKAERGAYEALDFTYRQLLDLKQNHPQLLEELHLPSWLLELSKQEE